MPAADRKPTRTAGEPPDLGLLFHRLNNQLGIILANAELLEAKARDEMTRARAAQVVASVLEAMTTARDIGTSTSHPSQTVGTDSRIAKQLTCLSSSTTRTSRRFTPLHTPKSLHHRRIIPAEHHHLARSGGPLPEPRIAVALRTSDRGRYRGDGGFPTSYSVSPWPNVIAIASSPDCRSWSRWPAASHRRCRTPSSSVTWYRTACSG